MRIPQDEKYVTGRDYASRDGSPTHQDWVRKMAVKHARKGVIDRVPTGNTRGKVKAEINFERWLTHCPDKNCNGAELVEFDNPVFFCLSCGNVGNHGNYYEVEFPDQQERVKIYGELQKRPQNRPPNKNKIMRAELAKPALPALSRSWKPGETENDLKQQRKFAENIGEGRDK